MTRHDMIRSTRFSTETRREALKGRAASLCAVASAANVSAASRRLDDRAAARFEASKYLPTYLGEHRAEQKRAWRGPGCRERERRRLCAWRFRQLRPRTNFHHPAWPRCPRELQAFARPHFSRLSGVLCFGTLDFSSQASEAVMPR